MISSKYISSLFLFIFLSFSLFAQQSHIFKEPAKEYKLALELFDKEKYAAARIHFENFAKQKGQFAGLNKDEYELYVINSEYYIARCALELFNQDAEILLLNFVNEYPENPFSRTANFQIGKFYYQQRKYKEALAWFKKSDISILSSEEKVEYKFKLAYSNFSLDSLTEARVGFEEVKKSTGKYSYPAYYYLAYSAYLQKDDDVALKNFEALKDSKNYTDVVPYYIASIYYRNSRYKDLIAYSKTIQNTSKLKNASEYTKLVASSYYNTDDYRSAISQYEILIKSNTTLSSKEFVEIGFSYYKIEKYDEAISFLKKISEEKSLLAQNGLYTLADCFLKKNDKQAARNAFWKASKLNFDAELSRLSLFNYAKLCYELQFHQLATEAFQSYLKQYPKSDNSSEARYLLSEVLISTKNYKEAVSVLEEMSSEDKAIKTAYQKVCYYRAVELFNDKDWNGSLELLNKSLSNSVDQEIQAQAYYWKAEVLYQKNDFENANRNFLLCLNIPESANLPIYNQANYNIAYGYFNMEDYKSSVFYFDKYLKVEKINTKCINDATIRMADGYFVLKNYDKALFNYNKIIGDKISGTDYALFQKGIILGLQNKMNDKVIILKNLLDAYPKSSYADDAYYETGNAYFLMGNISEAISNFNELIRGYVGSRYVPKAKLSLGLIFYNQNEDDKALNTYKSVINQYPGSEEAKEALLAIKNIYVDAGNADDYLDYVKTLPFASVTQGAQDSITFQAANNRYLLNDCDNAINGFTSYVTKFPNGYFIAEAHYNRAECSIKKKKIELAINDYLWIIDKNKTRYLERALQVVSQHYFNEKQYEKSASYYVKLDSIAEFKENIGLAMVGAMKSFMNLQYKEKTFEYANKVILFEKSSAEDINLAHLYLGKFYMSDEKTDDALTEFKIVTKNTNNEAGAEARYLTALIQYNKGDYITSQNTCFDLSNQIPSYDYWIAKAFILLADNYLKLGNEFQARSTLQSILDEYEGDDEIKTVARQKLEALSLPK